MADSDSMKKVLVGAKLQSVRGTSETGPATSFIIPAAKVIMDPQREFEMLEAENCGHLIAAIPLGYTVDFPLTIYGYPDKSFLGELMAMAIGPSTVVRRGSVGLASFIASVPATPGLNDATAGGAFTGTADCVYTIEIAAEGTPDIIKIKKDSGEYGTPLNITSGALNVGDGLTITFLATTGHTAGDIWKIKAFDTDVYRHTYAPADIPEVATFWSQEKAGESKSGDVVCNRLEFAVPQQGVMKVTADLKGGSYILSSDMGTPTAADYPAAEDSDSVFRSGVATLVYGETGAAIRTNLRTIDISIDRGIKPEEGRTQDKVSNANMYPETNRLTLEMEFLLTSLAELQRSWDGKDATAPTATSPDWTETRLPTCNVKLATPAVISSTIDSAIPASGNTSPNDLSTSGTYTGLVSMVKTIKISTIGATDKFQVKNDDGSYGDEITMTGIAQDIGDGALVTFESATGHVKDDTFTIAITCWNSELELDIPDANVQFKPDQAGGRRIGTVTLTPIATPADSPYTMHLQNMHAAAYT